MSEPDPCVFCKKTVDDVRVMVAMRGQSGPTICNECVVLCVQLMIETTADSREKELIEGGKKDAAD